MNNGGVYSWSTVAANNATADATVNYQEGQAPSSLNDSARAAMASVAKYRDDISGVIVTTGTSQAYIVNSNQVFDSVADMGGKLIAFTPHVTNVAGSPDVTLNVDNLALIPLRSAPNTPLLAGVLVQGTPYCAVLNAADNAFYLQGYFGQPLSIPIFGGIDFWDTIAPASNFIFPQGQAISRTAFATAFARWGTTFGAGDGSTTFNVPDKTGRVSAMMEAAATRLTTVGFGGNSTLLGAVNTKGGETDTLTAAQIPSITSSGANTIHVSPNGNPAEIVPFNLGGWTGIGTGTGGNIAPISNGGASIGNASDFSGSNNIAVTSNNTGGQAHPNVQPTICCNYIIRII